MSRCDLCHRDGLLFVRGTDVEGYVVLACQCPLGSRWRVKYQLRAFAAQLTPAPLWFGRLEEWFTPAEVQTLQPVEGWHPSVEHPVGK